VTTTRRGLLKVLGVGFGIAVTVGNTIGAGILRTPGEIAERLPSLGLFFGVWIAGAVYALLGAVSLAELGTMLPRSGGQYVFARHTFGRYAGFVVGWNDWLSTAGSAAAVAIVVGEYSGGLLPALSGRGGLVAGALVVALTLIQWRGIRWGDRTQQVTSLLKGIVLVALVVACFLLADRATRPAAITPTLPTGIPLLVAIIVSMQAVIYTFDGWTGVIYFSEEVRHPGRDIPRSMLGSVIVITAIYLLVNAAFVYVLPLSSMAGKTFVAGEVANVIFGPLGDTIIRIIVIVSLISAVNALVLMAPRVLFAMSRDGLFSARATAVNEGGTPTVSLLLSSLVALAFIATGTFNQVISVLAFFFVANYVVSFTALFVLRRREPDTPRPFRAWGYPVTTAIALLGSLAFLIGAVRLDPRNSTYALAVIAASAPIYLVTRRLMRVPGA
jgi:basic amino acid/polyamine antiporter, APA family